MQQLTFDALLKDALRATGAHARKLAGLILLPSIATAAIFAIADVAGVAVVELPDAETAPTINPSAIVVTFAALLVQTPAMAAWCRICLAADAPIDELGPVDSRATTFLWVEIKLIGALFAAMLIATVAALLLTIASGGAGLPLIFAVLLAAVAYAGPRFALALPAAALGDGDARLQTAWRRSAGYGKTLLIPQLLLIPPVMIATIAVQAVGGLAAQAFDMPFAAALCAGLFAAAAGMVGQCLSLSVVARAYASLPGVDVAKGSASP